MVFPFFNLPVTRQLSLFSLIKTFIFSTLFHLSLSAIYGTFNSVEDDNQVKTIKSFIRISVRYSQHSRYNSNNHHTSFFPLKLGFYARHSSTLLIWRLRLARFLMLLWLCFRGKLLQCLYHDELWEFFAGLCESLFFTKLSFSLSLHPKDEVFLLFYLLYWGLVWETAQNITEQ